MKLLVSEYISEGAVACRFPNPSTHVYLMVLQVPLLIFCWALCASAGETQREDSPDERVAELAFERSAPTAAGKNNVKLPSEL